MYAIVDIETTGGNAVHNKITEIGIFIFDGEEVVDEYQTLINPGIGIPSYIQSFTGISNKMVENAPMFHEVADRIKELTDNKIFVAHNVNFDYSFLRNEFSELSIQFKLKKLCTVRLSRNIFPDMPSYGLGSICDELNIPIYNRHRAAGDCLATVKLFKQLIENDKDSFIEYSLNRSSKEALLPPNLPREKFEALPESIGVYYFHDEHGNIVYIGKARNIENRVSSHFAGNTNTKSRQLFINSIFDVSFETCGTELIALLLESYMIKKHWPKFNRAQRKVEFNYGIYKYEDRSGLIRFNVAKASPFEKPLITFRYLTEARSFLAKKVRENQLCAKLSGLQRAKNECYDFNIEVCKGACCGKETPGKYNSRAEKVLELFNNHNQSFAIIGNGREVKESSVVVVEKGNYLGFGYLEREQQINNAIEFKSFINPYPDNPDVQKILSGFLNKPHHDEVLNF